MCSHCVLLCVYEWMNAVKCIYCLHHDKVKKTFYLSCLYSCSHFIWISMQRSSCAAALRGSYSGSAAGGSGWNDLLRIMMFREIPQEPCLVHLYNTMWKICTSDPLLCISAVTQPLWVHTMGYRSGSWRSHYWRNMPWKSIWLFTQILRWRWQGANVKIRITWEGLGNMFCLCV